MSSVLSAPYCPPCSSEAFVHDNTFPPVPVELVQRSTQFVKKKWRAGRQAREEEALACGMFLTDFEERESATEDARVPLPPPDERFCGISTAGNGSVYVLCAQDYSFLRDSERSKDLLHGPWISCEIAETADEAKLLAVSVQRREMYEVHENRSIRDKRMTVQNPLTSPVKKRLPPPTEAPLPQEGRGAVPWEHLRTPLDMVVISSSSVDEAIWAVSDAGAMYVYVTVPLTGSKDWVRIRGGHIDQDSVAGAITQCVAVQSFSTVAVGTGESVWAIGADKNDLGRIVARVGFCPSYPQGTDWMNMGDEIMPLPLALTRQKSSRGAACSAIAAANVATPRFVDVSVGTDGSVWAVTQQSTDSGDDAFCVFVREGARGQSLGSRWLPTSPAGPLRHFRPVKIAHTVFTNVFALLDTAPSSQDPDASRVELFQRCGITDTDCVGSCWRKVLLDGHSPVSDVRLRVTLERPEILPQQETLSNTYLSAFTVGADGSAWGIDASGKKLLDLSLALKRAVIAPSCDIVHDTFLSTAEALYDKTLSTDLLSRADLSSVIKECEEALAGSMPAGSTPTVSLGLTVATLLDKAVLEAVFGYRSRSVTKSKSVIVRPVAVERKVDSSGLPSFTLQLEWDVEAGGTLLSIHIVTTQVQVFDVIQRQMKTQQVATEVYCSAGHLSQTSNVVFAPKSMTSIVSRLLGTAFAEQFSAKRVALLQLKELPNEPYDFMSAVIRELPVVADELPSSSLRRLQQIQSRSIFITTRALLLGAARVVRIHSQSTIDAASPVVTLLCDDFSKTHTLTNLFRLSSAELFPVVLPTAGAFDALLRSKLVTSWSLALSNWTTNVVRTISFPTSAASFPSSVRDTVAEVGPTLSVICTSSIASLLPNERAREFANLIVPRNGDILTLSSSLEKYPLELVSAEGNVISCLSELAGDAAACPPCDLELFSARLVVVAADSISNLSISVKSRLRFGKCRANLWTEVLGRELSNGDDYPDGIRRVTDKWKGQYSSLDDDAFRNTSDDEPPAARTDLLWPPPQSQRKPTNDPKMVRKFNAARTWLALLPPEFFADGEIRFDAAVGGHITFVGQTDLVDWEGPGGVEAAVLVRPTVEVDFVLSDGKALRPKEMRLRGEGTVSGLYQKSVCVTFRALPDAPYFGPCTLECDMPGTPLSTVLAPFCGRADAMAQSQLSTFRFIRSLSVSGRIMATTAAHYADHGIPQSGWFARGSDDATDAVFSGAHIALVSDPTHQLTLSRRKCKKAGVSFALEKLHRTRSVWSLKKAFDEREPQLTFPLDPFLRSGDVVQMTSYPGVTCGTFRIIFRKPTDEAPVLRAGVRFQLEDMATGDFLTVNGCSVWSAAFLLAPTPFSIFEGVGDIWGNAARCTLRVEPSLHHPGRHSDCEARVRFIGEVSAPLTFSSHGLDYGDVTLHDRLCTTRGPNLVVELKTLDRDQSALHVALMNSSVAFLGSHSPVLATSISHGITNTVDDELLSFSATIAISTPSAGSTCPGCGVEGSFGLPFRFQASLNRASTLADERCSELPPCAMSEIGYERDTRFSSLQFVGRVQCDACLHAIETDIKDILRAASTALKVEQSVKQQESSTREKLLRIAANGAESEMEALANAHEAQCMDKLAAATSEREAVTNQLRAVAKEIEALESKISSKPHKEALYNVEIRRALQRRADLLRELEAAGSVLRRQQELVATSLSRLSADSRARFTIDKDMGDSCRIAQFAEYAQTLQVSFTAKQWTLEEVSFDGFSGPHLPHSSMSVTVTIAVATDSGWQPSGRKFVQADVSGTTLTEIFIPLDDLFDSDCGRQAFSSRTNFRGSLIRKVAMKISSMLVEPNVEAGAASRTFSDHVRCVAVS